MSRGRDAEPKARSLTDGSHLGRRLRDVRASLKLTLKDVEAASGFSATHISEIERNRSSPTIGALIRIAAALGKEPGFFLEEEPERASAWARGSARAVDARYPASVPLTVGVSGGALDARRIDLPAGTTTRLEADVEACGYLLAGTVLLTVGERSWKLGAGDAFHCAPGERGAIEAVNDASATLLVVSNHLPPE